MSSVMPLIPAYFPQAPVSAFNDKQQSLIYSSGIAVDALDLHKGGTGNPLALPYPSQQVVDMPLGTQEPANVRPTSSSRLPRWLTNDRKVLRYYGHFQEAVLLSAIETYRIRHITFHFFLSDDTLEIVEPKEENSGIMQGLLVKRHRVPHPSGGDGAFIQPQDLLVGGQVKIYGHTITITGADAFTRAYMQQQLGITLAPDMQSPQSPHNPAHVPGNAVRLATLVPRSGAGRVPHSLKDYLENSNKVLRFFCVWDDRTSLHGDRRSCRLHFYIENSTCEIIEDRAGSARDPAPVFLRRGLLPKHAEPPEPGRVPERSECFGAEDFRIGASISVFGRSFLIHSCDDFTRSWLQAKLGWSAEETAPIDVSEAVSLPHPRQLPPHNGFGSEEDSAQNCISLVPKAPRKDFARLLEQEGVVLRFACRLCQSGATPLAPAELQRRFVLSFFAADDTLSIFEPPLKNSGYLGGRYLDRRQVLWPGSGKAICAADLHVGAVLPVCQRSFELTEADAHTLALLEANVQRARPREDAGADAAS